MDVQNLPFKAIGDQPAFRPGDLAAFVRGVRIGVLAYLRADGRPAQSPIWYQYEDGVFYMSTVTGSPKARALGRSPRVCFTIQDEAPPYRAAIFDGDVTLHPMPSPSPTDGMAVRYFGKAAAAAYDKMTAEAYAKSGLTLLKLRPSAVRGFDNRRGLGTGTRLFLWLRAILPIPRRWL
jgi:PPOX class probable F420-dependent enzyme